MDIEELRRMLMQQQGPSQLPFVQQGIGAGLNPQASPMYNPVVNRNAFDPTQFGRGKTGMAPGGKGQGQPQQANPMQVGMQGMSMLNQSNNGAAQEMQNRQMLNMQALERIRQMAMRNR